MASPITAPRFEMVNVRPGYVIVEKEVFSLACRSYFSAEPVPPKEEYWEGKQIWKSIGQAQSFRFDIQDHQTGALHTFDELLGLLYFASCPQDSDIYKIGEVAQDNRIFLYIAVTYEGPDGKRIELSPEKLHALNQAFNARLRTPGKKILILPDLFGLYREFSHGQIMIDFGLTSLENEG